MQEKDKNINRIKAVLAEKNKTSKWLACQLNKDQTTVSKWCTNTYQPSLETLVKIAKCLNVDVRDLKPNSLCIKLNGIKKPEELYSNLM